MSGSESSGVWARTRDAQSSSDVAILRMYMVALIVVEVGIGRSGAERNNWTYQRGWHED